MKAFAERFGLLGYQSLAPIGERFGGDPVDWALKRAKEVQAVLVIQALLEEMRSTGRDTTLRKELPTLLRKIGIQLNDTSPNKGGAEMYYTASWPVDAPRTAWESVSLVVNPFLQNIHFKIEPGQKADLPGMILSFTALVDVIYWRLATQLKKFNPYLCTNCGGLAFKFRNSRKTCSEKCRMASWRSEKKVTGEATIPVHPRKRDKK